MLLCDEGGAARIAWLMEVGFFRGFLGSSVNTAVDTQFRIRRAVVIGSAYGRTLIPARASPHTLSTQSYRAAKEHPGARKSASVLNEQATHSPAKISHLGYLPARLPIFSTPPSTHRPLVPAADGTHRRTPAGTRRQHKLREAPMHDPWLGERRRLRKWGKVVSGESGV